MMISKAGFLLSVIGLGLFVSSFPLLLTNVLGFYIPLSFFIVGQVMAIVGLIVIHERGIQ